VLENPSDGGFSRYLGSSIGSDMAVRICLPNKDLLQVGKERLQPFLAIALAIENQSTSP
jgi:hypothetical protein